MDAFFFVILHKKIFWRARNFLLHIFLKMSSSQFCDWVQRMQNTQNQVVGTFQELYWETANIVANAESMFLSVVLKYSSNAILWENIHVSVLLI